MAERMTVVCDRNGRGGHPCPNEATTYRVVFPDGAKFRTDLCPTHAADLEHVREYGARDRATSRPKRKTFTRTDIKPL